MKDRVYLKHIRDSVKTIEKYLNGFDYDSFSRDEKTVDAVVRQLAIIGEAANNLDPKLRTKYPDIPWRNMIDMRNFIIHEYFGVNPETVWSTCKDDLSDLEKAVEKILAS